MLSSLPASTYLRSEEYLVLRAKAQRPVIVAFVAGHHCGAFASPGLAKEQAQLQGDDAVLLAGTERL